MIYGNCVGGIGLERTYILVDENGNEVAATMVDNETSFDATANDIRQGKVAATNSGVTVGTKEIPAYHTTEGWTLVPTGSRFKIVGLTHYAYTKLQVLICAYTGTIAASVSTEKVAIENAVYAVNTTDPLSTVTVDSDAKTIDLGIDNDSGALYLMRYFTYKEEY